MNSISWYNSLENLPNIYNFDLENHRFALNDSTFFVHDQIYYQLKKAGSSEQSLLKLGSFIGKNFKSVDSSDIFYQTYVKSKNKKNVRIIEAKHLLPVNGKLHKEIKQIFTK
ncbi:MAG: hypothetical protein AB7F64_09925 [Gammaproteobacteria bacterium]